MRRPVCQSADVAAAPLTDLLPSALEVHAEVHRCGAAYLRPDYLTAGGLNAAARRRAY
jgi:hypothetical protein